MFRDTTAQDRPITAPPAWRRRLPWAGAALALLLLALFVLPGLRRVFSTGSSVAASRLTIATVQRGDFTRDLSAEGRVIAAVSPTLYAPAAGTVMLKVRAGDRVEKDAVLAELASPELTNRLAQERAQLGSLDVDWQRAKLEARRQQISVQENYDRADVDRNTALRELERSRKAFELGAYSELQVLRNEDALAKAELALAHAGKERELEPEAIRFDVQSRKLARDRQALLVADLERQVAALALRAPVSGQIGQLLVAERTNVARDAPLITVVDLSALELELKVPESLARELAVGMPAEISGGGSWQGEVSGVSPEVVAGQVAARVRFTGAKPEGLRQNQRLAVRILLDERKEVLTLARGGYVDQDGGRSVYVVHDGVAERRAVRLGAIGIDKVEVLEGLDVGDAVVVSGADAFDQAERVLIAR